MKTNVMTGLCNSRGQDRDFWASLGAWEVWHKPPILTPYGQRMCYVYPEPMGTYLPGGIRYVDVVSL